MNKQFEHYDKRVYDKLNIQVGYESCKSQYELKKIILVPVLPGNSQFA